MSSNDQIILDQILEQQQAERAPHLTANKYFELFVAPELCTVPGGLTAG